MRLCIPMRRQLYGRRPMTTCKDFAAIVIPLQTSKRLILLAGQSTGQMGSEVLVSFIVWLLSIPKVKIKVKIRTTQKTRKIHTVFKIQYTVVSRPAFNQSVAWCVPKCVQPVQTLVLAIPTPTDCMTSSHKSQKYYLLSSEGQFICAGSDDGSFFIWDRNTTNIVRVMKGDDSIVNCIQPHSEFCLLATSGIDPVVRLWSPMPVCTN